MSKFILLSYCTHEEKVYDRFEILSFNIHEKARNEMKRQMDMIIEEKELYHIPAYQKHNDKSCTSWIANNSARVNAKEWFCEWAIKELE